MDSGKAKITDFELVEDLLEFIALSPDAKFVNNELETKAKEFPLGTLVKVQKEIGSPITVTSVEEVNEELISNLI